MKYERFVTSHWLLSAALLFFFTVPAAHALTLGFSNNNNDLISFAGDSTFSFTDGNSDGYTIHITNSDGVGDSVGLQGDISGTYTIGAVTTACCGQETAPVTGSGTLSIFDGTDTFSATILLVDITVVGTGGDLNASGTANVIPGGTYTGTVQDLLAMDTAPSGIGVISFQFAPGTTLAYLKSHATATSFSGSLTNVPVPAAVWLFGSALVGLGAVGRRRAKSWV